MVESVRSVLWIFAAIACVVLAGGTVHATGCGDGFCEAGECSSCSSDCNPTLCQGNSVCDLAVGERCDSSFDCRCASTEVCAPTRHGANEKGCYPIQCGDGFLDPFETKESCCKDAGCPLGNICDSATNRCVECTEDRDCKGLICYRNNCVECVTNNDCSGSTVWKNVGTCSQDNTKFIEKGYSLYGLCKNNVCVGNVESTREIGCKGTFCQDNSCGCKDGFEPCEKLGKCADVGILTINSPCGCDFQCMSGFCSDAGRCLQPINVVFSAEKTKISTDDTVPVSLSVDNNLNDVLNINIVVNLGDGLKIEDITSGTDCSGNQCKTSLILGERAREDVSLSVKATKSGLSTVTADVFYDVGGKEHSVKNILPITFSVTECGNDICEPSESSRTCCMDCGCQLSEGYYISTCSKESKSCIRELNIERVSKDTFIFLIIALILTTIVFGIRMKGYYGYIKEKEFIERKDAERSKDKERDLIRKTLREFVRKIALNNPPRAEEAYDAIEKQHGFTFDKKLFKEEYFTLITIAKEQEKNIAVKARFCTRCGSHTKENAKYCTRCGTCIRFIRKPSE